MSQRIDPAEAAFVQQRQRDDTGRVFTWDNRVFRAIFPEREAHVRAMFTSGFIDRMVAEGCFPETWISDFQMDGYPLMVEHKRIWPVTYPQDWTFTMLRDAAIVVCRTAQIAREFGYNMRDCHGLNVLFDGVTPRFIDLGSIVPNESPGWKPYEEFLRFYWYPLELWRYNAFVGKLSIFSGNLMSHETFWLSQHPMLRRLPRGLVSRLVDWSLKADVLASQPTQVRERLPWRARMLLRLVRAGLIKPSSVDLGRVIRRLESLSADRQSTTWAQYHERIGEKADRYERLIAIVSGLKGVTSAVDIGGNQGLFTRRLLGVEGIEQAVCIDADENAVDAGYARARSEGTTGLTFAHYDFMGGIVKLRFRQPAERFRGDLVVALALTHHLVLSQGYDLDTVFDYIGAYARQYVIIEFMPLGLWVPGQTARVPEWYNVQWFRHAFQRHFDLVHEEQLRENNIVFVGMVKGPGRPVTSA